MPIIHSYIIFCAGSVRIFFFLKSLFWHRERECEHTNGEQLAEGAGEAASLQTRLAFLRNICYSQATKLFSVFFSELYGFSFYVCIYDLSWVTFCVWCEVGVKAHFFFFLFGYPVIPAPFIEKIFLFPLDCFDTIVKYQMTKQVWISFQLSVLPPDLLVDPYNGTRLCWLV